MIGWGARCVAEGVGDPGGRLMGTDGGIIEDWLPEADAPGPDEDVGLGSELGLGAVVDAGVDDG